MARPKVVARLAVVARRVLWRVSVVAVETQVVLGSVVCRCCTHSRCSHSCKPSAALHKSSLKGTDHMTSLRTWADILGLQRAVATRVVVAAMATAVAVVR